jgi:hypothetical protein
MSLPVYRFTFLLDPRLRLSVPPGRHQPCIHGCVLEVDSHGLVTITGPSGERVREQARRMLRIHAKGLGAMVMTGVMVTPPHLRFERGGRDGWSIIVNADVAISPTSLPPDLGVEATAATR